MTRHNIPQLIALTLLALNTGGCGWIFGCGPSEPTITSLDVTDWNVDTSTYEAIVMSADDRAEGGGTSSAGYTGTAWADRDEESRCRFACAYALGALEDYSGYAYARSMTIDSCELSIPTEDADGTLTCAATITEQDICIGGRRPLAGLAGSEGVDSVAAQLGGMARMEQVSVTAFVELAAQLELRGAPQGLVERCLAAAQDERRHVELLVEVGAARPQLQPELAPADTSLLDIALHNAAEGCVTETWAALLASYQSTQAADVAAREAFAQIAEDEARHAQLAWELHTWLLAQLDPEQARAVEAALEQALAGLETRALQQALLVPRAVREALGLPEPRVALALAGDFGRRLSGVFERRAA